MLRRPGQRASEGGRAQDKCLPRIWILLTVMGCSHGLTIAQIPAAPHTILPCHCARRIPRFDRGSNAAAGPQGTSKDHRGVNEIDLPHRLWVVIGTDAEDELRTRAHAQDAADTITHRGTIAPATSQRRRPVSARNKERYACMQHEYLQDGPLLPTQHPHTHAVEIDDQRMLVELRAELSRKIRLVHPVSLPRWA